MITEEECEIIGLLKMLAAYVDGEGTISIYRALLKGKVNTARYSQNLTVTNTDTRLMRWLVDNFGGNMPKARRDNRENCKDIYHWMFAGSKSYKLIRKIHPYLILKQEQADCAIELYEKVTRFNYGGHKVMPLYRRELADNIYQRCRELNKRGKSNEEIEIPVTLMVRKDVLDEWL